jgi:hypothetical protein
LFDDQDEQMQKMLQRHNIVEHSGAANLGTNSHSAWNQEGRSDEARAGASIGLAKDFYLSFSILPDEF